jgi:hypothetical protein
VSEMNLSASSLVEPELSGLTLSFVSSLARSFVQPVYGPQGPKVARREDGYVDRIESLDTKDHQVLSDQRIVLQDSL